MRPRETHRPRHPILFAGHSSSKRISLLSFSNNIIFDCNQLYFHFQPIIARYQAVFTCKRMMVIRIGHGSAL